MKEVIEDVTEREACKLWNFVSDSLIKGFNGEMTQQQEIAIQKQFITKLNTLVKSKIKLYDI